MKIFIEGNKKRLECGFNANFFMERKASTFLDTQENWGFLGYSEKVIILSINFRNLKRHKNPPKLHKSSSLEFHRCCASTPKFLHFHFCKFLLLSHFHSAFRVITYFVIATMKALKVLKLMPRDEIILNFEFIYFFRCTFFLLIFNNELDTTLYMQHLMRIGMLVKQTFMRQERIFNEFLLFTDIEERDRDEERKNWLNKVNRNSFIWETCIYEVTNVMA